MFLFKEVLGKEKYLYHLFLFCITLHGRSDITADGQEKYFYLFIASCFNSYFWSEEMEKCF